VHGVSGRTSCMSCLAFSKERERGGVTQTGHDKNGWKAIRGRLAKYKRERHLDNNLSVSAMQQLCGVLFPW
jgi:hypothetical protein